jgi:hypothetical protein
LTTQSGRAATLRIQKLRNGSVTLSGHALVVGDCRGDDLHT